VVEYFVSECPLAHVSPTELWSGIVDGTALATFFQLATTNIAGLAFYFTFAYEWEVYTTGDTLTALSWSFHFLLSWL